MIAFYGHQFETGFAKDLGLILGRQNMNISIDLALRIISKLCLLMIGQLKLPRNSLKRVCLCVCVCVPAQTQ